MIHCFFKKFSYKYFLWKITTEDIANLNTVWELPKNKKPNVIIGAGGIVSDAHLPAYKKANFP